MTVILRPMTIHDYPASIQLWQNTEGIGLSSADAADQLALFLQRNPGLSFVAYNQAHLVGTVMCGHDGRRGFIYHLAVDTAWRGKGIGRKLVENSLAELKAAGIEKCHIMVLADNQEGLGFWQKMGWSLRKDIFLLSRSV
jgi:N-acetylglutamate synthase